MRESIRSARVFAAALILALSGATAVAQSRVQSPLVAEVNAWQARYHYGKHHQTYVDKLNELIAGKPEADMPLEDIVRSTVGDPKKVEILHNAQQTWNHTFWGIGNRNALRRWSLHSSPRPRDIIVQTRTRNSAGADATAVCVNMSL